MSDTSTSSTNEPAETAVNITLNGNQIAAREGELLIDAAERHGVYIPRFCYHHRMDPVGMCRMCIVEVDTGRGPALQPSCMLTVAPDMVVETESAVTKKAQDGILEFLLINHPLDCPVCDKGGECPLQDHTMSYGPGESRFVEEKRHYEKPVAISDHVLLDRERCILCDRCTRFAKDVAGDALIHFQDRGNGTQVNTFPEHPFASYFAGNTVQICPVGALTAEPYRFKARPWDLDVVESTCQDCSVGCRMTVEASRNQVLRYYGVDSEPVNWGWMCDKGRFGFQAVGSPDRLSVPLVRNGTELVETSWSDALSGAARAVQSGLQRGGSPGVAVIGGSRLTNESAYAWAKLAKSVIGTDNVDAQLGDGLPADFLAGLPKATIEDACTPGGAVLVIGADLKDELPVLFLRIRDAVTRRRATVIEISPRETSLSPLAAHSLRSAPGAAQDVVAQVLAGGEGFDDVKAALDRGPVTVILGRGSLAESGDAAIASASLLLEAHPEIRFLSAVRRANVHGAIDVGLAPGMLPGRVTLDDGRDWYASAWGQVPAEAGTDTAGILAAAADGRIDTLLLLGADPLNDFPDRDLAVRGLAGARTVIAVDTFLNDSGAKADIVLPAAGPSEVDGTTTNLEGRVTTVHQKVTPPGTAREDWMIAAELAYRLGSDLGFTSIDEIWRELTSLSPVHSHITPAALAAQPDGILAGAVDEPSSDLGAGGSDPAASEAAASAEGGAEATAAAAADDPADAQTHEAAATEAEAADASGEADDSESDRAQAVPAVSSRPRPVSFTARTIEAPALDAYSLRLITYRKLYDHGTHTRNSPSLSGLAGESSLVANPEDLKRLGVTSGDTVKVTSSRGSLTTAVTADAVVPPGTVSLPWNLGEPSPSALIDATAAVTEVRVETTS